MCVVLEDRGVTTSKVRTYGHAVCEACGTLSETYLAPTIFQERDLIEAIEKEGWKVSTFVVSMSRGHRTFCPKCCPHTDERV